MRNLHLEAAIWNLFTSTEFYEAAARECEDLQGWFGTLAISRQVANFGRNNEIFDKLKKRANDFRRGAELARLGDYKSVWDISQSIGSDVRGMMEQPLHSWMTEAKYQEFSGVRISRLLGYARKITTALNNAMVGADSFFEPDPDCPERSDDDDGFPGDKIVQAYQWYSNYFDGPVFPAIPDPLPEYVIDRSIECRTGDEAPWTGVWYPGTGLERHSLVFAIKGLRMPPAYKIIKSVEELKIENKGVTIFGPETVAEATTWHPLIPSGRQIETIQELRSKAGEPCSKAGIWQPMDPGVPTRAYEAGETMANIGSAYGLTVWLWIADR